MSGAPRFKILNDGVPFAQIPGAAEIGRCLASLIVSNRASVHGSYLCGAISAEISGGVEAGHTHRLRRWEANARTEAGATIFIRCPGFLLVATRPSAQHEVPDHALCIRMDGGHPSTPFFMAEAGARFPKRAVLSRHRSECLGESGEVSQAGRDLQRVPTGWGKNPVAENRRSLQADPSSAFMRAAQSGGRETSFPSVTAARCRAFTRLAANWAGRAGYWAFPAGSSRACIWIVEGAKVVTTLDFSRSRGSRVEAFACRHTAFSVARTRPAVHRPMDVSASEEGRLIGARRSGQVNRGVDAALMGAQHRRDVLWRMVRSSSQRAA